MSMPAGPRRRDTLNITALQLPFAIGYVSLIGAALVIPTSLLTAPLGVKAAHAMSKRRWRWRSGVTCLSSAAGL